MSDIVPACYERGASFREWACDTTMAGPSVREWLKAERETLLERIDWDVWDHRESNQLDLLDNLLGI